MSRDEAEIDALREECDRLRKALEHIASSKVSDGYRQAFYSLRWHARTTLTGQLSPQRKKGDEDA